MSGRIHLFTESGYGNLYAAGVQGSATISLFDQILVTKSFIKSAPSKAELAGSQTLGSKPPDSVPMLDLQRQYEQIRAEVLEAVGRVCASQHYVLGPEVEAFEREVADFCGTRGAVGCASGTDALWLALAAAGVQPGDQVLTTPFSFFASASAIVRAGARPVFADIEPRTFNLDPAQVECFLREQLGMTNCARLLAGASLWTVRGYEFAAAVRG